MRLGAAVMVFLLLATLPTESSAGWVRRVVKRIVKFVVKRVFDRSPPYNTKCPRSQTVHAPCGHTGARAWWNENDVVFRDKGRLFRVRDRFVWREHGPPSGSYFREPRTMISYSARDKSGNVKRNGCVFFINLKVKKCSPPPSPSHSGKSCSSGYYPNSHCTYSCQAGHVLEGSSRSTCRCRSNSDNSPYWTTTPSCPEVTCPPLGKTPKSGLGCTDGNSWGSKCTYQCASGYSLERGQVPERECLARSNSRHGIWTGGPPPDCRDTTKPILRGLKNKVLYADARVTTTKVEWDFPTATDNSGEYVRIEQVSGPESGEILEVGNYTVGYTATDTAGNRAERGFGIIIRDIECPTVYVGNSESVECSHGRMLGSTCTIRCALGYIADGATTLTCEGRQQGNEVKGFWSDAVPTCDAVHCPAIAAPDRGHFRDDTSSCPTVYGSWCYIDCDDGMHRLGSSRRHCLARPGETTGYWDGVETSCEAIYPCPSPYVAPHARIIDETECPTNRDASMGTFCRYACNEGNVLVGPENITCNYDGRWSDSFPRCQIITCERAAVPVPKNGYRNGCPDEQISYGTTCVIGCNEGYMPTASESVTCTADESGTGVWDKTTTTVCEPVKCVTFDPPNNGFIQGCSIDGNQTDMSKMQPFPSVCVGECNDGFTPSGTTNRKCLMNGKWDGVALECRDVTTPSIECPRSVTTFAESRNDFVVSRFPWEPLQITDASPPVVVRLESIDSVEEGVNRTTFFKEGVHPFVYLATDQEGNTASCTVDFTVKVTRCPALNIPQHGEAELVAGMGSCSANAVLGSRCSVSCKNGYHLAADVEEIITECMAVSNTSTTGYWDQQPGNCIPNTCGVPDIQNGYTSGCTGKQVDYQTVCTFVCDTGYRSPSGVTTVRRTCLADGYWTRSDLICQAVQCSGNFSLDHGAITPGECTTQTSFSYGSVCQFKCNNGFRQTGPISKRCDENGSWNSLQNVACIDVQAPRFAESCPQYIQVYAESGSIEAVVNYETPEVTDNAGNKNVDVRRRAGQDSGTRFSEGSHVVTFIAADEAGNHARCDIRITVLVYRCSSLGAPASGSLSCPSQILGASCSFQCNHGYNLEGPQTTTCVMIDSQPSWSEATKPTCTPVQCPSIPNRPPTIKSGCEQASEPYGTVCLFACPYGYQGTGSISRTCQADGTWSGEDFTCEEKQCPSLVNPDDIIERPVNCTVDPSFEDSCHFSCGKSGYNIVPSDVDSIRCKGDGQWSHDTSNITCKDLEAPRFTECPSDIIAYAARGATQASVKWNVTAVDNSGEIIAPDCNREFMSYPIGEYSTSCRASDSTGNVATCQFSFNVKTRNCQPLPLPTYGTFVGPCSSIHGSECTVGCVEGYQLEGPEKASCERNQATRAMYWHRESQPVCKVSSCPTIPQDIIPDVGGVSPSSCTEIANPSYGASCLFHCRNGYTLVGHKDPIRCQRDGTWNVDFETVEFKCEDEVKPIITVCPVDQYSELQNGTTYTEVYFDIPSARDNSGLELRVIKTPADIESPYRFAETTVVSYEFVDAANNSATCTFQVAVMNNLFPEVEYCPGNFRVNATGISTAVTWTEPRFTDPSGDDDALQTGCNYQNGANFHYGSYNIICSATISENGNTVECRFSVEVYPKPCPPLRVPKNGAMACDAWAYGQFCNQQCSAQFDVPPGNYDPFFICGSSGMWSSMKVLDCSLRRRAGSCNLGSELQYYSGDCNDPETQREIQEAFIELFNSTGAISDACQSNQDCRAENVVVTCGASRRRRWSPEEVNRQTTDEDVDPAESLLRSRFGNKKGIPQRILTLFRDHDAKRASRKSQRGPVIRSRRSTEDFVVTVSFDIVADMSTTGDDYEDQVYSTMDTLYDVVDGLEIKAEAGQLNPNVTDLDMEAQEDAVSYDYPQPNCEPGSGLSWESLSCVPCPAGTYYDNVQENCVMCPIAQYQDGESETECKACPDGTTTLTAGAQNQTECLQMCSPGHYSNNGVEPCAPCEIGFFQPNENKSSCIQCPDSKKTLQTGSTSDRQCLHECPHGHWSNTSLEPCQPCAVRYYQPQTGQRSCKLCPGITTTLVTGASDESHCNVTATCVENNCLNGATCLPLIEGPACQCPRGFEGEYCEVNKDDCNEHSCDNGGTCIDGINNFTCICQDGFEGHDCSMDILECATNPCYNASACADTPGSFVCECVGGFTGELCETEILPCRSEPCNNGATCGSLLEDFTCTCAPGYTGDLCEIDIDDCKTSPCINGGTCVDLPNGFECSCRSGFGGDTCEVDVNICDPDPCIHGVCSEGRSNITCICDKGMAGPLCDRNATACDKQPCVHGTCSLTDDGDGFSCDCAGTGYAGVYCDSYVDHCSSNPCSNGGTCLNHLTGYNCSCPQNFTGANCERFVDPCDEMPCQNNGSCIPDALSFSCACPIGFEGQRCETPWAICREGFCQNGGYCGNGTTTEFCICPDGYIGVACESESDECISGPCANGGVCLDDVNSYSCDCEPGFSGGNCEVNIDECSQSSCEHGICIDGINDYTCDCFEGFEGFSCNTNIDDCAENACVLGDCLDGNNTYTCSCEEGYRGHLCDEDIDECASSPCVNAKECRDDTASFECICEDGWTGTQCEVSVNDCSPGACGNGGTCIDQHQGFSCICSPGYTGSSCNEDINECLSGPCISGMCIDKINGYVCACPRGREGKQCQVHTSVCHPNPCSNGATCSVEEDEEKFSCFCQDGFVGEHCEINVDDCAGNNCSNGATCRDGINSYSCLCSPGFGGDRCEELVDPCLVYPCENGGACKVEEAKVVCNCTSGFEGVFCQRNIDDCQPNPCLYGGFCVDGLNSFTCQCQPGYRGEFCEENINECLDNECDEIGSNRCQDGVASYTCVCRHGFSGALCDIVSASNFDMIFDAGEDSQYVLLKNFSDDAVNSFTLALWIRTSSPDAVILSHIRTEGQESPANIVLRNPASLTLHIKGNELASTSAVNDDLWHHIAVTLDPDSELVRLYLDGSVVGERALGVPDVLQSDGIFILGQLNGDDQSPLSGFLSRLNVWDEFFEASQIFNMSKACHVALPGNVIGMVDFLDGEVGEIAIRDPSSCEVNNDCVGDPCANGGQCIDGFHEFQCECAVGFEGPLCEVNPDDCINQLCENGGSCNDGLDSFTCSCADGFTGDLCQLQIVHGGWGEWSDWTACSKSCDSGEQSRTRECNSPAPQNGGSDCGSRNSETRNCNKQSCPYCKPFRGPSHGYARCRVDADRDKSCTIHCNSGYVFSVPPPEEYVCGPSTEYIWSHESVSNPQLRVPSCNKKKSPKDFKTTVTYTYTDIPCSSLTGDDAASVESNIRVAATAAGQEICKGDCKVASASASGCVESATFRRRRSSTEPVNVTVTMVFAQAINVTDGNLTESDDIAEEPSAEWAMENLLNVTEDFISKADEGALRVSTEGEIYEPVYEEDDGSPVCESGSIAIFNTTLCVTCEAGTFQDGDDCTACLFGTYQPDEGQTFCLECPSGRSNTGLGAISREECLPEDPEPSTT